jgi:hypothetical protein
MASGCQSPWPFINTVIRNSETLSYDKAHSSKGALGRKEGLRSPPEDPGQADYPERKRKAGWSSMDTLCTF